MAKYFALWTEPEDVDGFENEYNRDHLPLAQQLPGIRRFDAAKVRDGNFYRVAELEFDSIESLREALHESPAGERLSENSKHLQSKYGVRVERLVLDD